VSADSVIEWTDATWNPVTGCTKVSPGCKHCYAETMAMRLQAMGQANYRNGFDLTLQPHMLDAPFRWKKPRRIFVNSMSDLFHSQVPSEYIAATFGVMACAPQHTFQVLTKRADRMRAWFDWIDASAFDRVLCHADDALKGNPVAFTHLAWGGRGGRPSTWPLPGVCLGVSVERDDYMHRIDDLSACPAAVRFLSLEPLLGPLPDLDLHGIHWVIVGGESGLGARPMDPDWVLDIRDQCLRAGVAFFFKQWGGVQKKRNGRELDGRTWDEMPAVTSLSDARRKRDGEGK